MKIKKPLNLIPGNLFLLLICTNIYCNGYTLEYNDPVAYTDTLSNNNSLKSPQNLTNKSIQASVYLSMGKCYNLRGNYSKALSCLNKALTINQYKKDSSKLIPIYNQIAYSLNHAERFNESYTYAQKTEFLLKKFPNPYEQIILELNFGLFYQNITNLRKSRSYYSNAYEINQTVQDTLLQIDILSKLGSLDLETDNLITAARSFRKALFITDLRNDNLSYQKSYLNKGIGLYYSRVNNLDSALYYLFESQKINEQNSYLNLSADTYKAISDLYIQQKDTSSAFIYLSKYAKINNELFHSTITKQISELYVQFNSKTKDQHIKLQNAIIKSEHLTKLLLISFLLFICIITVIVFINYYRLKLLNNTLKSQNKRIKKQNISIKENSEKLSKVNKELIESKARIHKQKLKLQIANKKYIKANASKDRFFDIIAHDLKSPFQSIMGFSSLLNDAYDELDDDKKKKYINLIDSSSHHVNTLIDNLLNWSRSQNDRINLVKTKFDLNKLVNEKINLFQLACLKKKIKIINAIPPETKVYGDMNMISLAIRNIISNAIKFSYAGGKVEISASCVDQETRICIRDYGIGMPTNAVRKIFNIDNSIRTIGTQGENGTGLGLIISKEYIEKNDGSISVISTIGKGSTFSIHLPSMENISALN